MKQTKFICSPSSKLEGVEQNKTSIKTCWRHVGNNLKKIPQLISKTNKHTSKQIPQLHVKKLMFRVC